MSGIIVFLCFCDKPTSPANPALPSALNVKFTNSDVQGWTTDTSAANGITAVYGEKDTTVLRALMDGGADQYFIEGLHQGMVQILQGPLVDSFPTNLSFYAIVYATDKNAEQMFTDIKSGWGALVPLQGFDTTVAVGYMVLGGVKAAAHFNKFYVELTVTGFVNLTDAVNTVDQMLQIVRQKAGQ